MNTSEQPRANNYQPETNFLAIASLLLSILGLLPILPLIGSIAGVVTGYIARSEIRKRPDLYRGEDYAKAGIILGWIGVALMVLAVCGLLSFLLLFTSTFQLGSAL